MTADLGHPAPLERDDLVRPPDRRQAVGDDERRPVAHQVGERVLHQALRFGVERRGRLVEDQDRRVLEDAPARSPAAAAGRRTAAGRARRSTSRTARAAPRRTHARAPPGRRSRSPPGSRPASRRRCCWRCSRRRAPSPASRCRSAPRSDLSVTSRMSMPSMRIAPDVTSKNRGMRLTSVVLPAPLSPTMAITCPASAAERHVAQHVLAGAVLVLEAHVPELDAIARTGASGRRAAALDRLRSACRAARRCAPRPRSPAAGSC